MSMVDEQNREEVVSEVATVEKEAEEIAADNAEPVSEETAEDTRDTESEVAEEVKGDAADETAGEEQTVSENTVSEAEEQPEEIVNETNDEETNDETDNEVSAEDLELVNEAENIEIEDIGEENASAEDTEKVKTAPEDTEATETAEAAEATEIQAAEESAAVEDEVAITEDAVAEEPAEEASEEVKVAASEIAEENIAASNEDAVDNTDDTANDAKIIRLPKIIHNDGIPATPIHKKSKFSKPVTKIVVKKAPVRDETAEELPAKEEAKKSAYLGKWKTETAEDGKMFAKLCASNGGVLLVTPSYTSDIGLKNGIASIKKHLAAGNVAITANKAGKFVFKVSAPSGRTIVTSEQYGARFQCEKALESAKRFAETAVVAEL